MGLLSGLLGNASEVDVHGIEKELELIVTEGELHISDASGHPFR